MDETYIRVKGEWRYLYRAVDKDGNTIDFLLRAHRDKVAARRIFDKSIAQNGVPETVTIDPLATPGPFATVGNSLHGSVWFLASIRQVAMQHCERY